MESSQDKPPSPGPPDNLTHNLTPRFPDDDHGLIKDSPTDNSLALLDLTKQKTLGHQSVKSGGRNVNLRVLFCTNLNLSLDYEEVHLLMKQYGIVEKI